MSCSRCHVHITARRGPVVGSAARRSSEKALLAARRGPVTHRATKRT